MRVTNVVRDKITLALDKEYNKKIDELYADKNAFKKKVQDELAGVIAEANAKADAILAKYPDLYFSRYGGKNVPYIYDVSHVHFPEDVELNRKAQELREKKQELAMDLEIRCTMEKDADKFFEMLKNIEF